ncbi:MAG: methylmalonyl-CoA mutase [Deltaproteobacteria bacterium]|nr:methylmalonyl-CoA mutase [Deltaproteobacteria bacterium]
MINGTKKRSDEMKHTISGIKLKEFYVPDDIKDIDYNEERGNPGQYPFVRGIFPTGYRKFVWQNSMISGYGLPEEANERQKYLREKGASGYGGNDSINFAFDNPCQNGYDCDHPLSKYEVGTGGIFINSIEDAEKLFDGFQLDRLNVGLIIDTPGPIILGIYVALADKLGISRHKLRGIVCNSPWRRYFTGAALTFPPKQALRVAADCITWATKEVPNFNTYSVNGYDIREGGATASQEMAFAIAPTIEVIKACQAMGAVVDDILPRFNFFLGFHNDFFEEVAKIRAGRKIWASLIKRRFLPKNPKSCWMKVHLQTSGCTLTAQEPLNNISRVAIQALGAVMSGIQSMSTDSYDEAISLPTEEAVRVALKTQKIIEHESGLTNVADPLGGSYYVEYITAEMEKSIRGYLKKIEKMGGYLSALENGFVEKELAASALKYQDEIEEKERIIVGVNNYTEDEDISVPPFEYKPNVREIASQRLQNFRRNRDNKKVEIILEHLKQTASSNGALMPIYIDAAKAGATMGEMMEVLKKVFGVYKPQNILAS